MGKITQQLRESRVSFAKECYKLIYCLRGKRAMQTLMEKEAVAITTTKATMWVCEQWSLVQ